MTEKILSEITEETSSLMDDLKSERVTDDSCYVVDSMYEALGRLDGKLFYYKHLVTGDDSADESNRIEDENAGYNGIMKLYNEFVAKYDGILTKNEIREAMWKAKL